MTYFSSGSGISFQVWLDSKALISFAMTFLEFTTSIAYLNVFGS